MVADESSISANMCGKITRMIFASQETSSTHGKYDIRWAAQKLRDSGKLRSATVAPRGIWEIAES